MAKCIQDTFDAYPPQVTIVLTTLKTFIFDLAHSLDLGDVTETIKWDEPSFSVKSCSPIRLDWKAKTPEHCYLFFNCQTRLIDTFRELYSDSLTFQGNRAIVLPLSEPIPDTVIKHCLQLALTYKQVKHLPLLGA